MKDTLLTIVQSVVDQPDAVTIDESETDGKVVFTIHTAPEDMGKVIGKSGRIIRAIRDIMKILATKHNIYIDVEIADDKAVA